MIAAAAPSVALALAPVLAEGLQFHPGSLPWIHLAWLVPALLLVYLWSFYMKRVALRIFASEETLRHLIPSVSWARQYVKCAMFLGGILCVAVATARPQWGSDVETIRRKGIDLVVLLDLSKSMLAEDMPPNRLEWAKADLGELLGGMTGDRIGLAAFAGRAEIRCPLTFDYGFFRRILSELRVGSVALGGTSIGDALRLGLKCFQDNVKNHKAILIVTDGEDHESFVKEAAEEAQEHGARIFSIGVGDTGEGKRIPFTDEKGNKVFLKDKEGKEVWTKMDPRVLLEAAQITDGGYAPAYLRKEGDTHGEVTTVRDIYSKILEKVRKKDLEGAKEERYKDRYQWFLALGWALLAIEPLLRTRRREVAAEPVPEKRPPGRLLAKAAPVLIALAAAGLLGPSAARAADFGASMKEGNRLYGEKKYPEAEEKYLQAKTERQEAAEVPYNIANTHYQREDYPKAMELYEEALKEVRERPLETRIRYNLACARARESEKFVGDLSSAENLQKGVDLLRGAIGGFRDVLELEPAHAGARTNITIAQLRVKSLLDELKRLREEAEKRAKEEDKDKKDPVELLKELIAEEKAEIELTRGAQGTAEELSRVKGYRDRLIDIEEALKAAAASAKKETPDAAGPKEDSALKAQVSRLEEIVKDPGFTTGGAEASESRKLAEVGDIEGAAKRLAEAGERILKEIVERKEAQGKAIDKDRTDQGGTLGKTMGLTKGLRDLAEGKAQAVPGAAPGGATPPPGQPPAPPPAPEPLPPEVKDRLVQVAGLTGEAGGKMAEALGVLGPAPQAGSPAPAQGGQVGSPDLPKVEAAQRAALELLEKALEEAEKLPKKEPPPQEDQKKDQDQKDSEKKKDGEKKDKDQEKKDQGKGEKKDEKDEKKEEKKEMTKEEAKQALRKFLEKDAERRRDKERRSMSGGAARSALDKDW